MSEMIERVAKAIYEGRNGVGAMAWAHRQDGYKDPYRIDARAAIEAMREPTQNMVWTAAAYLDAPKDNESLQRVKVGYAAMIEAALK